MILPRLLAGLAALCLGAAAAEPETQTYLTLAGGGHRLDDWPARVRLGGGVALDGRLDIQGGRNLALAVGRRTEDRRWEVEFQGGRFDVERAAAGLLDEAVHGRGRYDALTINGVQSWPLTDALSVQAALGIGWARVRLPGLVFGNGCACFAPASRNGWAWQARGGLEWALRPQDQLFVNLSRLDLPGPRSGGGAGEPGVDYRRRAALVWTVGWRHEF